MREGLTPKRIWKSALGRLRGLPSPSRSEAAKHHPLAGPAHPPAVTGGRRLGPVNTLMSSRRSSAMMMQLMQEPVHP
jgi:hypothetical protein